MALHVVFGAGQIGPRVARTLADRGHQVRIVRRSAKPVDGIEVVAGDARDAAFVKRVTEGAAAIYHCMNPSAYDATAWETEFPALGEALIAAAVANGARLVCLDNLYAYGPVDGPRTEDTPLGAAGRKGQVRVRWEERLRQAARDQGLRFAIGKAGDFVGPGAGHNSLMSESAISGLRLGKRPWLLGDPSLPHAFGYVPDVVAGLAALGEAENDVEGRVFLLPALTLAPEDLVARVSAAMGRPTRGRVLPRWLLAVAAPFVTMFGELRETWYQWDRPFLVDDRRFRERFPGLATPVDDAVQAMARPG
jgi:nucleoside-diphosphate-sugar epimerase